MPAILRLRLQRRLTCSIKRATDCLQMKMDITVDTIRKRFGFYSIQRGLMYRDSVLSACNAKEDHTVHPIGYFS